MAELNIKSRKRSLRADELRGILIFLVVLGHLIADRNELRLVFNSIYSFHMPLLMLLSGLIEEKYGHLRHKRINEFLRKRTITIVIPFISWVLIHAALISFNGEGSTPFFTAFIDVLSGHRNTGLWFLAVLFIMKLMHAAYWSTVAQGRAGYSVLIVLETVLAGAAFLSKLSYFVNSMSYFIPYFAGVLLIRDKRIGKLARQRSVIVSCLLMYMLCLYYFDFRDPSPFTQVMRIMMSLFLMVIIWNCRERRLPKYWGEYFGMLGKYSIGIYLLHGFLSGFAFRIVGELDSIPAFTTSMLCTGIISYICAVIMRILCYSKVLGIILFGRLK